MGNTIYLVPIQGVPEGQYDFRCQYDLEAHLGHIITFLLHT